MQCAAVHLQKPEATVAEAVWDAMYGGSKAAAKVKKWRQQAKNIEKNWVMTVIKTDLTGDTEDAEKAEEETQGATHEGPSGRRSGQGR